MDVLLLEDVNKIGNSGDVVRVAEGFARNFLIPKHLAVPATPGVAKMAKELSRVRQVRQQKLLAEFTTLKERLESLECNISVKVGKEDKLFGSVTTADIAKVLGGQGIKVDRRKIHLKEPIKTLGSHKVPVKLHPQVEASLKVWVVRQ